MVTESLITAVEAMLNDAMAGEPSYFLVELKIGPSNLIRAFVDGDAGISIDKCVQFSKALYKKIEEAALFPGNDFSLELSSPGLDEPLKLMRQYRKNIGRQVEVVLQDGVKLEGRLMEVSDDGIMVTEKKGAHKKTTLVNHIFLFTHIKTTKVQVVF